MRMRAAELAALRELLDKEYESEDAYLSTLWEATHALLRLRDAHLVWTTYGGISVAYGPIYGLTEAKSIAKLWAVVPNVRVQIRPVFAPAHASPAEIDMEQYSQYCSDCKHPKITHDWPGMAGQPCLVNGCECRNRFKIKD
jgi:hypothetical protein